MGTRGTDIIPEGKINHLKACRYGWKLYNVHDVYIGKALDVYGEIEEEQVACFRNLVKPGDVVLDIGANIGGHTVVFSKIVGPKGAVVAFEPQRFIFQTACANVALNSLTNVHLYHAAAGANNGAIVVPVLDGTRELNFGGLSLGSHERGERVRMLSIDSMKLQKCDFIKIDVEGMEAEVINGARETIEKHLPILYVENDREAKSKELIQLIQSFGYDMYWHLPKLYNEKNFFGNTANVFENTISINLVCVQASKHPKITGLRRVVGPDDHWRNR